MIVAIRDTDAPQVAVVSKSYAVGGKTITFESGKLALIADGSIVIRDEDGNYLLTTAQVAKEPKKDASFFPLTVEFQEKYYAAGKIGGNRFMKRESRPSENAVLNSRLIDRPIRPMFPKHTYHEVQIISTILSSSGISDYGFYGITGASLGLLLAGVDGFEGPVAGVRIAMDKSGNFKFDPTFEDLKTAELDLTVAGTLDAITMVEAQATETSEENMIKAFVLAHDLIKTLCQAQLDFVAEYKKTHVIPTIQLDKKEKTFSAGDKIAAFVDEEKIAKLYGTGKLEFHHMLEELDEQVKAHLGHIEDTDEMKGVDISEHLYSTIVRDHMRHSILEKKIRLDGRTPTQVRPIKTELAVLPRVHGSALFQRGITQALSVTTLGGPGDIQIVDDMFEENTKRYIHHYNFPPFSTGEIKMLRGPSRRDIGHGRLAEKALEPLLPSLETFPYFIRVVSEITTCNGSSSMASVCGSSLSLMDAGVPIRCPVAGIAMGMIYDENTNKYVILSDIQAQEDFLGDMDFKVARTAKGITALQMDCKIKGLSLKVVADVFAQAKESLSYILGEMSKSIAAPRSQLSPFAPSILSIRVPVDRIREVIGKGGETIQKITKDFSVEVDVTDDGLVSITAKNQDNGKAAYDFIVKMMRGIEVGEVAQGKVVRILDGIGAIVDLGSGKSGMIHISKIARERVMDIGKYLKIGDSVDVRVLSVDKENNRIGLERIIPETPIA